MNITMLLEMVAEGSPDRVVVGSASGGTYTAAELLERATRAALLFRSFGVEHVGFVDLNSSVFPVCLFGAGMAGLPFAPVNYRLGDEQLGSILQRLAPGVVVVGEGIAERVGEIDGVTLITGEQLLSATDSTPEPTQGV